MSVNPPSGPERRRGQIRFGIEGRKAGAKSAHAVRNKTPRKAPLRWTEMARTDAGILRRETWMRKEHETKSPRMGGGWTCNCIRAPAGTCLGWCGRADSDCIFALSTRSVLLKEKKQVFGLIAFPLAPDLLKRKIGKVKTERETGSTFPPPPPNS